MKTILLFFLSFGMIAQSFAQSKTDTIKLNFQTKHFDGMDNLEKIKRGEFYQLKITNINLNLYKVSIETKDTIITSTLTFPTFDMANLGGIEDVLSNLSQIAFAEILAPNKISDEKKQKKIDSIFFNTKSNAVLKDTSIKNIIKTKILEEKIFLENEIRTIKTDKVTIEKITLSIQKKILSYSILDTLSTYYKSLSTGINIDKILTETDQLRLKIQQISTDLDKHKVNYLTFTSDEQVKIKIKNDTELKDADSLLLESFNSTIKLVDELYESISNDKIMSWLTILINKDNNKRPYISLPQQLNGSETSLKISIIPHKEDSGLPSYMTTIKFPQRKRTYVGIGMGFYGATFKSNTYSTSATVIDSAHTNYKVVNENNQRGEIGLVTLLHFGWRPCKNHDWFALNLSTGPALSFTTTVKPRIALGGGVAFGRNQQMLSINALYMAGYVDQKSNVYDTNTTYNYKPENVTVNKLAGAFGLSLGYIYKF
ncbi:hypothetical protein [Cytophaga aurantiaca]|uniref:hypothetical protein n=1 Tax=Cytophaga aurantiaca TaxID=29530 RepID=UPI000362C33D|nr:hypothetical protein [Cytophaga aurantiaca]